MSKREFLSSLSEEQIKGYKEKSMELPEYDKDNLHDIVLRLKKLRDEGKLNYYGVFRGIKFYSVDVTLESAYKEVSEKENSSHYSDVFSQKKEEDEFKQFEEWKKICRETDTNFSASHIIAEALDIIEMLKMGGSCQDYKTLMHFKDYNIIERIQIMLITQYYTQIGPQFIEKLIGRLIEEKTQKAKDNETLKHRRILNISLSFDLTDTGNFDDFKDYYTGRILANDDLTFEGIIADDRYVKGKILEDGSVSLVDFCNYLNSSQYCGIKIGNNIIGRNEIFTSPNHFKDKGGCLIELTESTQTLSDKIAISERIKELKAAFDEETEVLFQWFNKNFDIETARTLSILRAKLKETREEPTEPPKQLRIHNNS